jgi:hypothetical protein
MTWRNLSIIIVLFLANYLVFSTLAVFLFPPQPIAVPTHEVQATFTPGARPLVRVGTLTYDFLTPEPGKTITSTLTVTTPVPTRQP